MMVAKQMSGVRVSFYTQCCLDSFLLERIYFDAPGTNPTANGSMRYERQVVGVSAWWRLSTLLSQKPMKVTSWVLIGSSQRPACLCDVDNKAVHLNGTELFLTQEELRAVQMN